MVAGGVRAAAHVFMERDTNKSERRLSQDGYGKLVFWSTPPLYPKGWSQFMPQKKSRRHDTRRNKKNRAKNNYERNGAGRSVPGHVLGIP